MYRTRCNVAAPTARRSNVTAPKLRTCHLPARPPGSTPLEEDEALLHGQAGVGLLAADPRQHAAVVYRVERKRLLAKTAALLRAYARGAKAG